MLDKPNCTVISQTNVNRNNDFHTLSTQFPFDVESCMSLNQKKELSLYSLQYTFFHLAPISPPETSSRLLYSVRQKGIHHIN